MKPSVLRTRGRGSLIRHHADQPLQMADNASSAIMTLIADRAGRPPPAACNAEAAVVAIREHVAALQRGSTNTTATPSLTRSAPPLVRLRLPGHCERPPPSQS